MVLVLVGGWGQENMAMHTSCIWTYLFCSVLSLLCHLLHVYLGVARDRERFSLVPRSIRHVYCLPLHTIRLYITLQLGMLSYSAFPYNNEVIGLSFNLIKKNGFNKF